MEVTQEQAKALNITVSDQGMTATQSSRSATGVSQYIGQPNVCPGCGRCNCCGRTADTPYNPYGYPAVTYATSGQAQTNLGQNGYIAVNAGSRS